MQKQKADFWPSAVAHSLRYTAADNRGGLRVMPWAANPDLIKWRFHTTTIQKGSDHEREFQRLQLRADSGACDSEPARRESGGNKSACVARQRNLQSNRTASATCSCSGGHASRQASASSVVLRLSKRNRAEDRAPRSSINSNRSNPFQIASGEPGGTKAASGEFNFSVTDSICSVIDFISGRFSIFFVDENIRPQHTQIHQPRRWDAGFTPLGNRLR